MSRYYSLKDIRDEIKTELRNTSTENPRYTDGEITLAIRRATNELSEYFWFEDFDSSKAFAAGTYTYAYDFPVRDIYRVELTDSVTSPPQITNDWWEEENNEWEGSDLLFLGEHGTPTITVRYERHPIPYPDDFTGTLADASDTSLSPSSITDTIDWPETGWLKIGDEICEYSEIDRTTGVLTVTRGQKNTVAAAHSGVTASFINLVNKNVFVDGVKEFAIYYLNRSRIIDAASSDVQGNVTIVRLIDEHKKEWIRTHKMRTKKPLFVRTHRARPLRDRRRGV